MKPYLAIVKDAFREAFNSKVLYLLLIVIGTVLICLTPLSYIVKPAALLTPYAVADADRLAAELTEGVLEKVLQKMQETEPTPDQATEVGPFTREEFRAELLAAVETASAPKTLAQRLFQTIPTNWQVEILDYQVRVKLGRNMMKRFRLQATVRGFNDVIQEQNLSEDAVLRQNVLQADFADAEEASQLVETGWGNLSEQQQRRLNRLIIKAALPEVMRPVEATSVSLTYFGYEPADEIPLDEKAFRNTLLSMIQLGLSWCLNGATALIGIIITASMIPRMFESGSLALLLSKPLSRSGMFLMQFLSGGVFVLIVLLFLMIGLFTLLGIRFGIWELGLLGTIPVFMLAFGVYYSVSALAGLIWRNAIVSVIVTVVFWATCMTVYFANWSFDTFLQAPTRIIAITPLGDEQMLVRTEDELWTGGSQTLSWNVKKQQWEPKFNFRQPKGHVGPTVYLGEFPEAGKGVVELQGDYVPSGFGAFGLPAGASADEIVGGFEQNGFQPLIGPPAAVIPLRIFPPLDETSPERTCHLLSRYGIYELELNPQAFDPTNETPPQPKLVSRTLGLQLPAVGSQDFLSKDIAIFSNGRLALLRYFPAGFEVGSQESELSLSGLATSIATGATKELGRQVGEATAGVIGGKRRVYFKTVAEVEIEDAEDLPARVALGGGTCVVALADGRVILLDGKLELVEHFEPLDSAPIMLHASPAGDEFALLMEDGTCYQILARGERFAPFPFIGQQGVQAVAYDRSGTLYVATNTDQVRSYEAGIETDELAPAYSTVRKIYEWVVEPIYYALPSVWSFDYALWEVLSSDEEVRDKTGQIESPFAAVLHAFGFVILLVSVCCIYMETRDF